MTFDLFYEDNEIIDIIVIIHIRNYLNTAMYLKLMFDAAKRYNQCTGYVLSRKMWCIDHVLTV